MADTKIQQIAVLERMRELLADPDRVVLNPEHYFEKKGATGEVVAMTSTEAKRRRDTCRVCFCGAATLASWEIAPDDFSLDEGLIRPLVHQKIIDLGIAIDRETRSRFGSDDTAALTSALKQGRAVEVVDAVLADLRSAS